MLAKKGSAGKVPGRGQGKCEVTFPPSAGISAVAEKECATAVALLLFGMPVVWLPGSCIHPEPSAHSLRRMPCSKRTHAHQAENKQRKEKKRRK